MYRQQAGQFDINNPMTWYSYHQGAPPQAMVPPNGYCMQEDQVAWHHPAHAAHPGYYQNDFQEYVQHHGHPCPVQHGYVEAENQLPSPPITVSGSEMSSPGGASGHLTPPNTIQNTARPPPARSPYEWIKKTSYQTQPNPELETISASAEMLDFTVQDCHGKTRTKDKYRVVYTDHQRVELEKEFYYSRYITIRRKAELASNLGLSERQVKIWFQNRRAKERKQVKKREELNHKENVTITNISQHQQQLLPTQHMVGQGIIPVPII